jgi:hypothetical protein
MEKKTKKALTATVAGLVAVGIGMAAGAALFPVEKTVEVPVEVIKTVEKEVVKEVPGPVQTVYEVREVAVDSGKLDDVLEAIYAADGDLEFVTDDLKESEIAEIADRLVFEMDAKTIAAEAVRAKAVDTLHKEELGSVKFDEDDIVRIRVQNDRGEIEVLDRDFEDGDAEVKVTAFFEQDDIKYAADFLVLIKEGKFDDIEVDSIYLR